LFKHILITILFGVILNASPNFTKILNETNQNYTCIAFYPAISSFEEVNGYKQTIIKTKKEDDVKIIKPNDYFIIKRKVQRAYCFNKINMVNVGPNKIQTVSKEKEFKKFMQTQDSLNPNIYINEGKEFLKNKSKWFKCIDYEDGEYCAVGSGLDFILNKNGQIKKAFFYQFQYSDTEFNKDSILNSRNLFAPIAPWIKDEWKKVLKKKPTIESNSAIVWLNPSSKIKHIIMTPRNGHIVSAMGGLEKTSNKDMLKVIEVEYAIDKKAYERHQIAKEKAIENSRVKVEQTWGNHLNPYGNVPRNKFKAFYFNRQEPKKVIASEEVKEIAINYPNSKLHNIPTLAFGGYWVGEFDFKEKEKKDISIALYGGLARVIVDDRIVFSGKNTTTVPFIFQKGRHKIEVEYMQNSAVSYGIMLKVDISKKKEVLKDYEIQEALKKYKSKFYYIGIEKTNSPNFQINVNIEKSKEPISLLLSSGLPITWHINNPYNVKIETILYSSMFDGAKVKGQENASLFYPSGLLRFTSVKDNDILSNYENVLQRYGKKLSGISAVNETSEIKIGEVLLSDEKITKIKEKIAQSRANRSNKGTPNKSFDSVFK